ncbi:hypothetical protein HNQ88_000849 [Aureibacter tunicatorum]|uniref:Uncharacterized protein n=1 Tax=Aureibacter tunicatorum TaxID=866807 RepID=A0AAE3XJP0_9BACT|nr:hypothetical protein [Aureibacter tunicatorum]BDD02908.1 hypothetical protein AUTU_03910 [Aureibacter tunicatorum]
MSSIIELKKVSLFFRIKKAKSKSLNEISLEEKRKESLAIVKMSKYVIKDNNIM